MKIWSLWGGYAARVRGGGGVVMSDFSSTVKNVRSLSIQVKKVPWKKKHRTGSHLEPDWYMSHGPPGLEKKHWKTAHLGQDDEQSLYSWSAKLAPRTNFLFGRSTSRSKRVIQFCLQRPSCLNGETPFLAPKRRSSETAKPSFCLSYRSWTRSEECGRLHLFRGTLQGNSESKLNYQP